MSPYPRAEGLRVHLGPVGGHRAGEVHRVEVPGTGSRRFERERLLGPRCPSRCPLVPREAPSLWSRIAAHKGAVDSGRSPGPAVRSLRSVLLAFDTATPYVTVALHDGESVVAEARSEERMKHGEQLAPLIAARARRGRARPAGPDRDRRRDRTGPVHGSARRAGHGAHAGPGAGDPGVRRVLAGRDRARGGRGARRHQRPGRRHRRAPQGGLPRGVRRAGHAALRPGRRQARERRDRPAGGRRGRGALPRGVHPAGRPGPAERGLAGHGRRRGAGGADGPRAEVPAATGRGGAGVRRRRSRQARPRRP